MSQQVKAVGFLSGRTGDAVIQTVVARAFKLKYPDSHLTFALSEQFRDIMPLFYHHPYINSHHVWEGHDNWPTPADVEYVKWRGYDIVYDAMAKHSQPDWYNHRTYGQEACARFGFEMPADQSYLLNPWFPLCNGYKKHVTLSLVPNRSKNLEKTMPKSECEKLCIALRARGYTPLQLGGRFDVRLDNAECPDFSILEATQHMLSSAFHITADTAFSSIAAGYGHRTLGFYGVNYPDMKDCFSHLPPNPAAHYIKNRDPRTLTADDIVAAIEKEGFK